MFIGVGREGVFDMQRMRGFVLLAALWVAGSAAAYLIPAGISAVTGTTTQAGGLATGTGDFIYDGQTVALSSWPKLGNLAFVKWVRTPLLFDCAAGTLSVTDKTTYQQEQTTLTFTPPAGSVIVGVLVKSGSAFDFVSAAWSEDGSAATVTITKGFSGSAIFYCTAAAQVATTVVATTVATSLRTTTSVLATTTTPAATTATVAGTTTSANRTTTQVFKPAKKVTKAKGKKKTKKAKKAKHKPKVVSHKRPKVTG